MLVLPSLRFGMEVQYEKKISGRGAGVCAYSSRCSCDGGCEYDGYEDVETEGSVMKVSTDAVKWARDSSSSWASQVTKYNGRYYLYFCTWDKTSQGKQSIGVAVADKPTGSFKNIGAPLVKGTLTKPQNSDWDDIDPTVWVDTDSRSADIINRSPAGYTEAPRIYRRKDAKGKYYGEYYLFYASGWHESMAYSTTSDLINGEWNYGKILMPPNATSNTNHMAASGTGREAADAKWLIMAGKADRNKGLYVSIQSENKLGLYITANSASNVTLAQDTDASAETARRQTFRTVQGLAGSKGISFESVAYLGYFLTIVNGTLTLRNGADREAATFYTSLDKGDPSLRSIAATVKKNQVLQGTALAKGRITLTLFYANGVTKKTTDFTTNAASFKKKKQHKKLGTVKITKKTAAYFRSRKTWKKGKSYYFHIRTYSKVNGMKKYSSYRTRKVKIK